MEHCAYIFLSEGGGDKSVNEGEGISTFLDGGTGLDGGELPPDGRGFPYPPSYWTALLLFIFRQSKLSYC